MAILAILMLALVRMFNEAGNAVSKGTTSVTRTGNARAAMEIITRDLEGCVVDRRIPFYKEANTVDQNNDGFGFDTLFFVTMSDSPSDERGYEVVHYYVDVYDNQVDGVTYRGYRLYRETVTCQLLKEKTGLDVLSDGKLVGWWKDTVDPDGVGRPTKGWDQVLLVDNVVRFDVWACDEAGDNLQSASGGGIPMFAGGSPFASVRGAGKCLPNQPPRYIDVYLQVTSDEAMKRGGLSIMTGWNDLIRSGRSLLYRDSNVLMTRVRPIMAGAEIAHPIAY